MTAKKAALYGQKSTERRDLETDNKEKCASIRRCEDKGDTTEFTHYLVFCGDAGAKATSLAMPGCAATYRIDPGTQTLSVCLGQYEIHKGIS